MPPAPFFIVGCPRSGNTLVRAILNMHPRLTIPDETYWIVALAPRHLDLGFPRQLPSGASRFRRHSTRDVDRILQYFTFPLLNLEADEVLRRVDAERPRDYAALVRLILGMHAASVGKPRWGDKTPRYVAHLRLLHRMFPDAQFVHVVRDGRVVAASLSEHDGRSAVCAAGFWRKHVMAGRCAGEAIGPSSYLEVRLEDLTRDPTQAVKRICRFLGERFAPEQLEYFRELDPKRLPYRHRHLARPPEAGLRDWRNGLSRPQQMQIEALCAPALRAFGYDAENVRSVTTLVARGQRAAYVAARAPRYLMRRGIKPLPSAPPTDAL